MEFLFSAGGLVHKKEPDLRFILIQTRNFKGQELWQLPKGKIEEGETAKDAALREVLEETGARATIREKIGSVEYFFKYEQSFFKKKVTFFLMEYQGGVLTPQAGEVEAVGWFSPEEAKNLLSYKNEWQVVEKGLRVLNQET